MNHDQNTKLMISFCNVLPRGLILGVFDFVENKFQWLDLGDKNKFLMGAMSIIFHENKYLVLSQIGEKNQSGLMIFDHNCNFLNSFILEKTKDAHSLIPYQKGFLVTNTASNEINKITVTDVGVMEEEFWKYENHEEDTVHVNSIVEINGKILVSIFGNKPKEGWLNAKSGKIIDIFDNTVFHENLYHPHTLTNINNELFCLESNTGIIHRFKNKNNHEKFLELEGYLRGMTDDDKFFYVGASARRRKSKSKGTLNSPLAEKYEHKHSWIYRIDKKTLEVEKRNISLFGSEIFELKVLSEPFEISSQNNPIIQRMWRFEEEFFYR